MCGHRFSVPLSKYQGAQLLDCTVWECLVLFFKFPQTAFQSGCISLHSYLLAILTYREFSDILSHPIIKINSSSDTINPTAWLEMVALRVRKFPSWRKPRETETSPERLNKLGQKVFRFAFLRDLFLSNTPWSLFVLKIDIFLRRKHNYSLKTSLKQGKGISIKLQIISLHASNWVVNKSMVNNILYENSWKITRYT